MFDKFKCIATFFFGISLIFIVSFACNINKRTAIHVTKQQHAVIREAFKQADRVVALELERSGIEIADEIIEDGLTGEEAYGIWTRRMDKWFRLEVLFRLVWETLEELESIYEQLELENVDIDWFKLIKQTVLYMKEILEIAKDLDINLPDSFTGIYDKLDELIKTKESL